jgi:hypothetical protein
LEAVRTITELLGDATAYSKMSDAATQTAEGYRMNDSLDRFGKMLVQRAKCK